MSQSAAQAAAFFRDVTRTGHLWTVDGYPAPMNSQGQRSQPFWSTEARVSRIIKTVPAYASLDPEELDLARWRDRWLPSLQQDGLLIGLNWTGPRAKGYDVTPNEVIARLNATTVPTAPS